jgi:hypothetical protein
MSHGQAAMLGLVVGLFVGWFIAWMKQRQIVEHLRLQVAHELERIRKGGNDSDALKIGAMVTVIAANEAPEAARERLALMAEAYQREDRAEMFRLYMLGLEEQIELLAAEVPTSNRPAWIGLACEAIQKERARQ